VRGSCGKKVFKVGGKNPGNKGKSSGKNICVQGLGSNVGPFSKGFETLEFCKVPGKTSEGKKAVG